MRRRSLIAALGIAVAGCTSSPNRSGTSNGSGDDDRPTEDNRSSNDEPTVRPTEAPEPADIEYASMGEWQSFRHEAYRIDRVQALNQVKVEKSFDGTRTESLKGGDLVAVDLTAKNLTEGTLLPGESLFAVKTGDTIHDPREDITGDSGDDWEPDFYMGDVVRDRPYIPDNLREISRGETMQLWFGVWVPNSDGRAVKNGNVAVLYGGFGNELSEYRYGWR